MYCCILFAFVFRWTTSQVNIYYYLSSSTLWHYGSTAIAQDAVLATLVFRRELTEPSAVAGRLADKRKMKSAWRRGNIGPSAGLVILELTEPADRPAVVHPML